MRKLITLLLFSLSFMLVAQDQLNVLTSTNQQDYSYESLHKLTFQDNSFTVHFKDGTHEEFTFTSIQKLLISTSIPTGLDQFSITELSLFPNPVSNTLEVSSTHSGTNKLHILNLQGKVVLSQTCNFSGKAQQIDVSSLSSGIYLLQIENTNQAPKLFIKK